MESRGKKKSGVCWSLWAFTLSVPDMLWAGHWRKIELLREWQKPWLGGRSKVTIRWVGKPTWILFPPRALPIEKEIKLKTTEIGSLTEMVRPYFMSFLYLTNKNHDHLSYETSFFTRKCFLKEDALPKPRPDKRRAATAGDSLAKVAGVDKLDNRVSYFICKYPPGWYYWEDS